MVDAANLNYYKDREYLMIRVALIGLRKMGIFHHAILNTHPDAQLVAVLRYDRYVLDVLNKYTGVRCYTDYVRAVWMRKSPTPYSSPRPRAFTGRW